MQRRFVVALLSHTWMSPKFFRARQPFQRMLLCFCLLISLGEFALTQTNQQNTLSTTYPVNLVEPQALAIADLNGDGHPDLIVASYCFKFGVTCPNGGVGVMLGNADGTFQPMVTYSLPFPVFRGSVFAMDLNGDGHPDLIVSELVGDIFVMIGVGDGTFGPPVVYDFRDDTAFTMADVNGDHFPDLIILGCLNSPCSQPGVNVKLNNGDGTFGQAVTYDSGGQPNSGPGAITVADVNQDGHPDLLVANACSSASLCSNATVSVLLGNGDGTFRAPFVYDSGGGQATYPMSISNSIVVSDVNGDGHPDLLVANSCYPLGSGCSNATVGVLLGNGNGTFQEPKVLPLGGQVVLGLALANLTGVGLPGLIATSNCVFTTCTTSEIDAAVNNGDGTFQRTFQLQTNYPPGYANEFLQVADLNGDGRADLLVANYCGVAGCTPPQIPPQISAVGVFLGNGSGGFQPPVNYTSGGSESIQGMQVLDVNGDGRLDLITLNDCAHYYDNCDTGSVAVLLGNGDGTFPQGTYPGPPASGFQSFIYGQTATITAQIFSDAADPTGTIVFYDGGSELATADLVSNIATYTTTALQAGTHIITAKYSGDSNDSSSTASWLQLINPAATTTTLLSSSGQSYVNQNVTFTAAVVGQYGGAPTGTVTFTISGNKPVTVALNNGQAIFPWTFLYAGQRTVTASYSGDSNYLPSEVVAVTQLVNALSATQTSLTSSLNPSVVNQPVNYTATVASQSSSLPSGSMTFVINSNKPVTVPLNNGQATFAWTFLYAGPHTVTASYSGDFANAPSVSSALSQVVNTQTTATTLTSSLNPSAVNQAVAFNAVVTGQYGNVLTGSVIFTINGNKPVTVPLNNGQATFDWTFLYSGPRIVSAAYSGDVNDQASVSPTLNQTVTP